MNYLTRSHWGAEPPVKTLPVSKYLVVEDARLAALED